MKSAADEIFRVVTWRTNAQSATAIKACLVFLSVRAIHGRGCLVRERYSGGQLLIEFLPRYSLSVGMAV